MFSLLCSLFSLIVDLMSLSIYLITLFFYSQLVSYLLKGFLLHLCNKSSFSISLDSNLITMSVSFYFFIFSELFKIYFNFLVYFLGDYSTSALLFYSWSAKDYFTNSSSCFILIYLCLLVKAFFSVPWVWFGQA